MKYYFCVTDRLKPCLLSILSLLSNFARSGTFSLIIYIGKGKHFIEKKSFSIHVRTHHHTVLFRFSQLHTISIRMKNSNPFLGVPSVSSNTLIKPNAERGKQKNGLGGCKYRRDQASEGEERLFSFQRINNVGTDVMKI